MNGQGFATCVVGLLLEPSVIKKSDKQVYEKIFIIFS